MRVTILPDGKEEAEPKVVSITRGELDPLHRWGDGERLAGGTAAPNIEMTELAQNQSERLADFRGKVVVLEFWATWCGPCQKQVAKLQDLFTEHPEWKDKVVLIAASLDDERDVAKKHLETMKWNSTHNVWVDVPGIKALGIDSLPTIYVIDQQGNIVGNPEFEYAETVSRLLDEK